MYIAAMPIEAVQILIAVISLLLFLRVYWIQAGSNSLISMMKLENNVNLNEIEFAATTEKQNRESILDAFGYLNLVAKLYLNHSINISMLRTFEGVMIKFLNDRKVQRIYKEIYVEFRDELKTAEPPFINLIYATQMLKYSNKILIRKSLFAPLNVRIYLALKYLYFRWHSHSAKIWKLAASVFEEGPEVGKKP